MGDYNVNAQFLNCVPLSCHPHGRTNTADGIMDAAAGTTGIWIEKYSDHFYICASWVAQDFRDAVTTVDGRTVYSPKIPPVNRAGNQFAGFAVFNKDFINEHHYHNPQPAGYGPEATVGVAIYPTIQFEVIGIPTAYRGNQFMSNGQMSQSSPTISLV